ncbi:MAG: hypothetical protein WDZ80_06770 [Candidatus Paceibacterota bacterium]
MKDSEILIDIKNRLTAVLILLSQVYIPEETGVKLEVLLDKTGLSREEIALIIGKSKAAVDKAIQRAS